MKRSTTRSTAGRSAATVLALAVALAGFAACGDDDDGDGPGATTTSAAAVTTTVAETTTTVVATTSARVYLVRGEQLGVGVRTVAVGDDEHAQVLLALFGAAGSDEGELGLTTAIPAGTELRSVDVIDRAATVDLTAEFASGGGSLSMLLRVAQVVYTVTQFGDVDSVTIWIDGEPVDGLGGEGVSVDDIGRSDFTDQLPMILLEEPGPGATVTSPIRLTGASNTFEATINYTLEAADGTVLAEGMEMASSGTGTWGTFDFEIDYDAPAVAGTTGTLSVYDISEMDGVTHDGEVTIPVIFG